MVNKPLVLGQLANQPLYRAMNSPQEVTQFLLFQHVDDRGGTAR